ncbi:CPBP family glutamic-type intramembrane protease [Lacibacter sp. MH-610]|uniref:CPBP family glutamic-type intramembrane protease n=1 Tax=Lacibacter sp. MH-610 TaxID=3020883 RepID=UPI00389238F1
MQQPLIKQGWLRAVLFLIAYLLLMLFTTTALSKLSASISLPDVPALWGNILIQLIVGILLVLIFRKWMDRASIKSLGLPLKQYAREAMIGFVSGIFLCHFIAVVLWLMQLLEWIPDDVSLLSLLPSFLLMVLVAFTEELVFRGYMLNNLMQSMNEKTALFASAFIFAAAHSFNAEFNLTAFFNILLAGLLLGINYIFTRNLWFGILLHLSWNFVQGPVIGFKVSGLELPSLLQQNLRGSILLTGGEFGLEASWLTTIVFGMMIPVLYSLFHKKYKVPSA